MQETSVLDFLDEPPIPTTVAEIQDLGFRGRVQSFSRGARLFISNGECSRYSVQLLVGCARQYAFVVASFGAPSFPPNITPELQTTEYLAQVPLPSELCCRASYNFHSSLCACDVQTIQAFRSLMLFDPEATIPGSKHLYGTLCQGPATLGDDCPGGNPFDKIRAMESSGRKLKMLD